MDNFILYDEIFKTESTIIYKGRRKGSINFVAIHCIEKTLRPEITNLVRLTYEINHKNTVKFYEWYETSNHLWLVVELCTAGPLEVILEQDGCLPESSIKQFGLDLCEGLFYVHSLGLLFCDLIPRKIMVDGNGNLKLSDFGFAKQEGEDLESIFQETFETTSSQWAQSTSNSKPPKIYKKPFGDINYMAPEVILGEDNSQASDFWSLGCIFYKMYTGNCPFIADDVEHLKNLIVNRELPNPKGNKMSTKPSNEFLSLLKSLLEKTPNKRLNWRQLLCHPFWDGKLKHLMPGKSVIVDGKEQFIEFDENEDLIGNDDQARVNPLNFSRISTDRPRTAVGSSILDQKPEINVSFSISSRLPSSPQATMQTRNPVQYKESDEQQSSTRSSTSTLVSQKLAPVLNENDSDGRYQTLNEYRRLFFLPSELNVSQIIDNPKIQKPASLKFEPKTLPFTNPKYLKAETLIVLSKDEFTKCLELIKSNTNVPSDKSASAIKLKLHLMNYIGTLCSESTKMADSFIQIELYKDLMTIIKNGHNLEMKMKAARIMAIIFNKAKKVDSSKELTEIMQSLVDTISANRKDLKFKQALLPALGELIHIISCQEILIGKSIDVWSVPSLAYVLLIRSIGEDLITNHIVCKIVENIASTNSINVKKFLANQSELVNAIWSCYTHSANNEQLRIAALNALSMLTSHSINVFTSLIDKFGVDSILDCLSTGNHHVQQPMLTMISMLLNESNAKILPEKKLIAKLVTVYESTNVVCRSKAYLLTLLLLKQQNDLLINFAQSKLINSIERDSRKSFTAKEENDYIHKVINLLVELVINLSSNILDENVNVLESVYGRKNPSTTQTKQLKRCIPNVTIIKLLITSQIFRSKLASNEFIEKIGKLIKLSKPINEGELNLDNVCGGSGIMSEYINGIISILETIIQNNDILNNYSQQIMKFVLPSLMDNINSTNSDLRVASLKIVSELSGIFFGKQTNNPINQDSKEDLKNTIETQLIEITEQLLAQQEPLPFLTLTIIQQTLGYDITLINILKVKNVLPSLIKFLQTNKSKIGSSILIKLLNILDLWSSTVDPSDLYENGIVEPLKIMIMDVSRLRKGNDDRIIIETLIELLRIVDNLLKYVSEFVKKALQIKKIAGANDNIAQQAEKLLHSNKQFVVCNQFLISLFIHEDNDLNELSCKILWVIMQLFGSECKDLLTQENLNTFL